MNPAMSATFRLDPDDARNLAAALDLLTDMTRKTGVSIDGFTGGHVHIADTDIRVRWDGEARHYIIDDRIGE